MIKRFFSSIQQPVVDQLENLQCLVHSINNTSSLLQKRLLITENPSCHSILKRIYNPHVRHHLSSKTVLEYMESHPDRVNPCHQNLDQLLESLSSRTLTGNEARRAVADFYNAYCQTKAHKQIFWRVIDRNLKMGVSEKTVRHVLSDQKEFSPCSIKVALAYPISKIKQLDLSSGWYASQKLDGIRCLSLVRFDQGEHDIQFLSRSGRPFNTLQKVANDLKEAAKKTGIQEDFVLDGEVCAYGEKDTKTEVFKEVLSQIRRLNEEMKDPVYHVFDYIPMRAFLQGKGDMVFSERQSHLTRLINEIPLKHVKLVDQQPLKSVDHLDELTENAVGSGWEGLILRRDVPYEGKRTNNLLKVKEWEDAEYTVNGIDTTFMRIPSTGENKLVLKNVNIEHKGNTVSVGSGFSVNERIDFAKNPELILGKAITVRYFSESVNKNDLFINSFFAILFFTASANV